jgi:TrmH family RNA methyltransferase
LLTSPENDKVKFAKILTNRRDRYASKTFLAEGVRLVAEALASHNPPSFTLYDPEALQKTEAGHRLLLRLKEMLDEHGPAYPTTARLVESVSDTETPQGVVAAIPFLNWTNTQLAASRLHLILDELQDPGNLGTILRSAAATGDVTVWLTENCVDIYAPKTVRAGMGAHFRVPAANNLSWATITAKLEELGVKQILVAEGESDEGHKSRHAPDLDKLSYLDVDWSQPVALVIGNEAHGPSLEARRAATNSVYIPMPGGAESLNAAIAASVIMFEALRRKSS